MSSTAATSSFWAAELLFVGSECELFPGSTFSGGPTGAIAGTVKREVAVGFAVGLDARFPRTRGKKAGCAIEGEYRDKL